MNVRHMLEVTALVSAQSGAVIEAGAIPAIDNLQRFWSCSKAIHRHWADELAAALRDVRAGDAEKWASTWVLVEPLLIETLATELTIRVWGAILTALEPKGGSEAIARNALAGFLDARQRTLQVMTQHPWPLDKVARLDQVRRRIERWTDLLIGHLVCRFGVADFAFEADRARDFGEDQLAAPASARRVALWHVYLASLRESFAGLPTVDGIRSELRQELTSSMLGAFEPSLWRADGPFLAPYLQRFVGAHSSESQPFDSRKPQAISSGSPHDLLLRLDAEFNRRR